MNPVICDRCKKEFIPVGNLNPFNLSDEDLGLQAESEGWILNDQMICDTCVQELESKGFDPQFWDEVSERIHDNEQI